MRKLNAIGQGHAVLYFKLVGASSLENPLKGVVNLKAKTKQIDVIYGYLQKTEREVY